MRDFLAQHPIWGSRRFGVLDADEEFSKGGDFVVLQILNGQFHPVTPDHLPPPAVTLMQTGQSQRRRGMPTSEGNGVPRPQGITLSS